MSGPTHLTRARLTARITDALDAGVLLLVAPAGYGKTVALTDALSARGTTVAWVRCTAADRDPGRLLQRLVATLAAAVPGVAEPIGERLAAAPAPIDVAARAQELAAALERLALDPLTIAFDDAEHLGPEATAAVVAPLVEMTAASPRLRVALCSRREPGIPRAARLRAGGRLASVGPGELAFAPDECAAYLAARTGAEPDQTTVDELYDRTEGWPLGVVAAGSRPSTAPLRSRDAVLDYFQDEVLDRLDHELRAATLTSALPRELDATTLKALGLDESFTDLAAGGGLFLRPSDANGNGSAAAYHPLFREFLLGRLAAERPPAELSSLRARLAEALDRSGHPEEAIEHWLDARAWDDAAAAIARTGASLLHVSPGSVERWIGRLPATSRRAPGIAFIEGRLTFGAGRATEAVPLLRDAVADAAAHGDLQAEWIARYALADALYLLQRYPEVDELVTGFDQEPATLAFAAPLVAIAGAASLARGAADYDAAVALYRRATAHPLGAAYAPHETAFRAFYVDLPAGRLDQALAGIKEGIALCEKSDPGRRLPYLWGFRAMIHEERGEDQDALAAISHSQHAAAEIRGYITRFGRLFTAGLHARAGRLAEAEAELRAVDPVERGWFSGDAEVTRATIAVRRGEGAVAAALAEEAVALGATTTWGERVRATAHLATVLAAAGRPMRARDLIDEALELRPAAASGARLTALRAWLDWDAGERDHALEGLNAALAEAGAAAAGHLLRREWQRLEPLVTSGVATGVLDRPTALSALERAFPGGDVLLPFTHDDHPATRAAAIRALASSGNPAAAARVLDLTGDPDPTVAQAAIAAAERTPPPLVIELFGGFAVRRGAWAAPDAAWGRRAAARLVRLLIVSGESVPEDALVDALWPDRDAATARRGMQVAVSAARRVLDLPGSRDSAIEAHDSTYRLRLNDSDVVDTHEFERAARAALKLPTSATLESAAAAWTGEPLPEDRYEPWAIAFRERLLDLRGQLLGELADRRADAGDANGAVAAARELVAIDPLAEAGHRRLMRVYARAGRRGHALRQFLECRRLLVDELGVEPDTETAALHAAILAGEPIAV